MTSANADHHKGSMSSSRRESILSPKRLSQAFDFAVTSAVNSVDGLYKQAQALLEDQPPRNHAQRNDLESGGAQEERKFGEESSYNDWLD